MRGMAARSLVRVAAQNNAEWCDAFCRTHGVVGRFRAGSWFSPVRTPPYYPDAVTLLPELSVEQLLSGIDTGEGCSVKDSFAWTLRLLGFGLCSGLNGSSGSGLRLRSGPLGDGRP